MIASLWHMDDIVSLWYMGWSSEAFSMHDWGTGFLILLLADPHSLEGRQGAKNGATNPDEELPFSRSYNLDFHGGGGQSSHLFIQTLRDARVHSSATAHHNVAVEVFSDVDVALKNGVVCDFVEPWNFLADHHGLEEGLRTTEALWANSDHLTIRKLIGFFILVGVLVGCIRANLLSISAS